MSTSVTVFREGWRLAWASKSRAAIVVGTVAAVMAILVATGDRGVPLGAALIIPAIVFVARRSPAPTRTESAAAWRRAGAPARLVWAVGTVEIAVLGWAGALAGIAVGLVLPHRAHAQAGPVSAWFIIWQLAGIGLISMMPTSNAGADNTVSRRRAGVRDVTSAVATALRISVIILGVVAIAVSVGSVRTDFDLGLVGLYIMFWLVVIGTITAGVVPRALFDALERIPELRAVCTLVQRRRVAAPVRLVVVTALTIATSVSVLGASVEARPDRNTKLQSAVDRVPEWPPNVALVRLQLDLTAETKLPSNELFSQRMTAVFHSAAAASLTTADIEELTRAVPRAHLVPVRHIVTADCDYAIFCNESAVLENPRLGGVYRSSARYKDTVSIPVPGDHRGAHLDIDAFTRVPAGDAMIRAVHAGHAPVARFTDAVFDEVPASKLHALAVATPIRSIFVVAPDALRASDLARIHTVAKSIAHVRFARVTTTIPRAVPRRPAKPAGGNSLRAGVPWAAATTASRWSLSAGAALVVLVIVLGAFAIETIDRRRDVERLERLGASGRQVRQAAALQAGVFVASVMWLELLLALGVVYAGTRAFNRAEPLIPVPLTVPWAVVGFLAFGLPVLAGALAAAVARSD